MKASLQLRHSQHLALTPQLQQSIRLLQLSTLELHQELEQILADNPLLERLDNTLDSPVQLLADGSLARSQPTTEDWATPAHPDPTPASTTPDQASDTTTTDTAVQADNDWSFDTAPQGSRSADDEDARPQLEAAPESLRDHLMGQVRLMMLSQRDRALLEILVDAVDDRGYLQESLEEIHGWLPPELDIDPDELSIALKLLQSLEPAGVGARTPSECLAIQVRRLPKVPFVTRRLALVIVEEHLPLLSQRDYNKIRKATGCDEEDLREVQAVIRQCTPYPGRAFASDDADYVVPDVIVESSKTQGWQVRLNEQVIPNLRVNALYASALKQEKSEGMTGQLQEARWLVKNMRQRFDTILRVSQAIVERQVNFFSYGEIAMKPLVLREIADTLGLHESTISRVTTQKYMLTPHGMFELKFFFGSHVATETGGEASSTAIRALIRQFVGEENARKPLSDSKIADMLAEQGIVVARRTIAKYRDILKIPPVNLRKAL